MNKQVFKSVMSTKGQVVLPKELREHMGLHKGMTVEFHEEGGRVTLEAGAPVGKKKGTITVEAFRAMLPVYKGPPITEEMIEQAIVTEARRRWRAKGG